MTQEKLPHRKELCLQSEAGADAPAFLTVINSSSFNHRHEKPCAYYESMLI